MPHDYPKNPPKATFKTRIYHPNVEETTGAVCLETLKRDWDPKLTLKDILVTISCLLIQPNPDSALNAAAGALIQEDYEAFSTQAKLMTRIHAPIPRHLVRAVQEAKRRGEEDEIDARTTLSRTEARETRGEPRKDNTKENDQKQTTPFAGSSSTTQRRKRSLSEMPPSVVSDQADGQHSVVENPWPVHADKDTGEPTRKSPKLTRNGDPPALNVHPTQAYAGEGGTENSTDAKASNASHGAPAIRPIALRKLSNVGACRKGPPRVGIRRL